MGPTKPIENDAPVGKPSIYAIFHRWLTRYSAYCSGSAPKAYCLADISRCIVVYVPHTCGKVVEPERKISSHGALSLLTLRTINDRHWHIIHSQRDTDSIITLSGHMSYTPLHTWVQSTTRKYLHLTSYCTMSHNTEFPLW